MKRLSFFLILCVLPFFAIAQDSTPAHEGEVTSITFSKDNSLILTGGSDKKIRVWDSYNGKMLYVSDCGLIPEKIFVNPDNTTFIASNQQRDHILYDLKTGERIKELDVDEVLGYTPDGEKIITAVYGEDGFSKFAALGFARPDDIYDTRYFSQSKIYFDDKLKNPKISSDGSYILLPAGDKKLLKYYEENPFSEEEIELPVEADEIAIHGSDSIIAVAGSSYIIETTEFKKSRELQQPTLSGPEAELWFSSSGSYLISKGKAEMLIFKVGDGSLVGSYRFDDAELLAADDEAIRVAYADGDGYIILENLLDRSEKQHLEAPDIKEKWAFQDYLIGVYYYHRGKYQKALDHFVNCEGKSPRISNLYLMRGECFFKTGDLKKSMNDFLSDHKAVPGRSSLYLARIFAWKGYPEEAKKWLDTNRVSPFKVAIGDLKKDEYLKDLFLEERYRKTLDTTWETEAEKLAAVARKRYENNEVMAALEFMDKAIALEPKNPSLYHQRGLLYMKLLEMDKARKDFMTEAKLNPAVRAESYQAIARTYSRSSEYYNAIIWIKRSIKADASYYENMVDVAEIYQAGYRRNLAIGTINEYLELVPDDYYAYYLRATMNVLAEGKQADIKKAIALCEEQGDRVPFQFYEVLESVDSEARVK